MRAPSENTSRQITQTLSNSTFQNTRILRAAGRFSWSPLGYTANSKSRIIALHLADELTDKQERCSQPKSVLENP
jgi:hypothetical protein